MVAYTDKERYGQAKATAYKWLISRLNQRVPSHKRLIDKGAQGWLRRRHTVEKSQTNAANILWRQHKLLIDKRERKGGWGDTHTVEKSQTTQASNILKRERKGGWGDTHTVEKSQTTQAAYLKEGAQGWSAAQLVSSSGSSKIGVWSWHREYSLYLPCYSNCHF